MENNNQTISYLDSLEAETRWRIETIRKLIIENIKDVEEYFAYGTLAYKNGKSRLYLGGFKNHISLFPGPRIISEFSESLKQYKTSKGTIQFSNKQPLPERLIADIIVAVFA